MECVTLRCRPMLAALAAVALLTACGRKAPTVSDTPASPDASSATHSDTSADATLPAAPKTYADLGISAQLPEGWSEQKAPGSFQMLSEIGQVMAFGRPEQPLPLVIIAGLPTKLGDQMLRSMGADGKDAMVELMGEMKKGFVAQAGKGADTAQVLEEGVWKPNGIEQGRRMRLQGQLPDFGSENAMAEMMAGRSKSGSVYVVVAAAPDEAGLTEAKPLLDSLTYGDVKPAAAPESHDAAGPAGKAPAAPATGASPHGEAGAPPTTGTQAGE